MSVRHVAATTPYPWPYDGDLDPSHLALIVAGYDGEWRKRCLDPSAADRNLKAVASAVHVVGGLVVGLEHPRSDDSDDGDDRAYATTDALRIAVGGIDGFYASTLDHLLRQEGRDHLLIAGYGLEGPVHSTMRSANDRGYECLLVLDAAASLEGDTLEPARSMVEMSGGIFGAVGLAAEVIAALESSVPPTLTSPARSS